MVCLVNRPTSLTIKYSFLHDREEDLIEEVAKNARRTEVQIDVPLTPPLSMTIQSTILLSCSVAVKVKCENDGDDGDVVNL
jgi:hypothetical protein